MECARLFAFLRHVYLCDCVYARERYRQADDSQLFRHPSLPPLLISNTPGADHLGTADVPGAVRPRGGTERSRGPGEDWGGPGEDRGGPGGTVSVEDSPTWICPLLTAVADV